MEKMDRLGMEIRRIIACPYPPSLKQLHEVSQEADPRLLQSWAQNNPCQIHSLAAAILEGLEYWPLSLDLLRILSCIPAFRNAALQQKPALIYHLLEKAIESDGGFVKFAPTCISMLSTALTVPVPSNIPTFLEKLLENATTSKSIETIRSVYQTLSGLGLRILDDLTPETLARFQNSLNELLMNLDMSDPFADILCLAVLAKFASRPCHPLTEDISCLQSSTDTGFAKSTDGFLPSRRYFVGKRARKTFDLAVLRVINACSRNSALCPSEALETLTLSGEVIHFLDRDDKKYRIDKNGGMIKNLYGKVLRPDIDPSLQCATLDLILNMFDGQELPGELMQTFEKFFLAPAISALSFKTVETCMKSFSASIISESLRGLLRLACASTSPSMDALHRFDSALQLVSNMILNLDQIEDRRQAILEDMTKKDATTLFHQFATQQLPGPDLSSEHELTNVCPSVYIETRNRFHQNLGFFILNIGLRLSSNDAGLVANLITLLEKQTKLLSVPSPSMMCQAKTTNSAKSTLSLFQSGSTPHTKTISHSWKDVLHNELSRDVNRQYESVIRMVGEICRDLESRCSEAEGPFRDEQTKSRDLQAKLEDSRIGYAELEALAQSQNSELSDLRKENNFLLKQAGASEERLQDLRKHLDQMHQEFEQTKSESECVAQAALEKSRQRDLDHMAVVTGKDLILEEQASRLAALEGREKQLEDELARQKLRTSQNAETINNDKALIEELRTVIATAEELAASKQIELDRLTASKAHMIEHKEQIVKEAQEKAEQFERLIADQRTRLETGKVTLEQLQHEHERCESLKDAEIQSLQNLHKSSYEKLHTELEETRKSAATAREQNFTRVTNLQKKLRLLRKEREARAEEAAEARAMKMGFIAFMGNINNQPGHPGKKTQSLESGISRNHSRSRANPEQQAPNVSPATFDTSFGSSTSIQSELTPKRMSIRPNSNDHRVHASKKIKSDTNPSCARIRTPRTPLADLGATPNSNHLTPAQRISWEKYQHTQGSGGRAFQEENDVRRWCSNNESFDGGDMFTSADERKSSGISPKQQKLWRTSFDETTADF